MLPFPKRPRCLAIYPSFLGRIVTRPSSKCKFRRGIATSAGFDIIGGVIVEKIIPFHDEQGRLRDVLRKTARDLDGICRFRKDGTAALALGSAFSPHPNAMRTSVVVRQEGAALHLTLRAFALPWTERKVRRIAEFRLLQVAETIQALLKGETPAPAILEPFGAIRADHPVVGTALFAAWATAAAIAGFAATLLLTWLLGLTLMSGTIDELMGKALLVHDLGGVPLPSVAELQSIDASGPALLFALPIAFGIALLIVVLLALGELFPAVGRLVPFGALFCVILLLFALIPLMDAASAIGFSLAIPLAAILGYSLVWGRKGEIRNEPVAPGGKLILSPRMIAGGAVLLIVAGFLMRTTAMGKDLGDDVALLRDRLLLGSDLGKAVADFYYRNTMYPAEIIKPLSMRTNVCIVTDSRSPILRQWFARRGFLVEEARNESKAFARFRSAPFDLIVFDKGELAHTIVEQEGLWQRSIILATLMITDEGQDEIFARLDKNFEWRSSGSYRGSGLASLSHFGWTSVFLGLPVMLITAAAAFVALFLALLYRRLDPRIGRLMIGALIVLAIGGAAVLLMPTERGEIVAEIRRLPKKEIATVDQLIGYLASGERDARYEAAYRIYQYPYGNLRYVDPLLKATEDIDIRVKMWAALALGNIGDARALDRLIAMLEDPQLLVRCKAAEALAGFRSPKAVAALTSRMKNDQWYVGWYCYQSLRRMSNP